MRILYNGKPVPAPCKDTVFFAGKFNFLSDSIRIEAQQSKTTSSNQITIKRENETFTFQPFTISYSGYSPKIKQFDINTPADSLKLGGPVRFFVMINNDNEKYKYSGIHIYKLTSGTSVLSIDTLNYVGSDSIQVLTIDTIKDTLYPKLTLTVYNSDTLSDTGSIAGIKVLPSILDSCFKFRDSSTTVDQDSSFKVDVVINESFAKDTFYWSYRNVKDSLTVTPFITIPPSLGISDTISVYVKRVYNFGEKKYEFKSDTLIKRINPKSYPYKIQMTKEEPKQLIAKNTETFQVHVTNGNVLVPDSLLTYSWIFPPADSNFVKITPKNPKGSSFSVTVLDSTRLKEFYFSVMAKLKNGTDSTALKNSGYITVRNYKPSLSLIAPVSPIPYPSLDIAFNTYDSNGVVSAVYYKYSDTAVNNDISVKSVAPQSKKFTLLFTRNGKTTVKAWAVDSSGFVSDTQKVTFDVLVLTPQFPIKPDTIKTTIGSTIILHAPLVSKLDSITYLWDRDGNGDGSFTDKTVDTTTFKSDSISFTPQDSIPDTIYVQCVNKVKQQAPTPYTIIVVARKNGPVIDTFHIINTNAKYKNDSIQIKACISDPDSNLKSVRITWSLDSGADSLLFIDSIVQPPFKTDTIIKTKKDTRHGTYKFTVTATDSRGNINISSITHSLLPGDPIIDSVRIKSPQSLYFLKKKINVTISAKDPNRGGEIASVQFIKSNDTSVIATKAWPDSNPAIVSFIMDDTGLQHIRVRVIDNEGRRSVIDSTPSQIKVLTHVPRADSIKHTDSIAYIKKETSFTIVPNDAYDSSLNYENSILMYSVSLNDTLHFEPPSALPTFRRTFTTPGMNRFFVKVTDADNFYSIKADSILVLDGKPVFVSGIDQKLNYWIKDENTLTFICSDPIGTVDKLDIDWGDGIKVPATRTSNNNSTFIFEVKKTFRNVSKKDSTYRFTLTFTDSDANITTAVDSITIKQGKPALRPSFGNDSTVIFGKYDQSSTKLTCTLSVHATDTPSGEILNYYWFLSRDSSSLESANHDSTDSTYILENIPTNLANTIYTYVTVLVMDDDSNIVKKKFNIYIDAPPQVPVLLSPVNGITVTSPVVFEWTGYDVHDSLSTKFSIYVRIPGSNDYKLIQNPVITNEMVGTVPHFKYTFIDTKSPGSYSWKVVATDQLGSVTTSDPNVNSSFAIGTTQ
jgi:hypothetical protein